MIGRSISHYKILSELGRGGMGVVYKATDTKLERPVALKFLAAHAIEDPEHKARFVREAKAAARLDHQNICPIYEIDEVDGQTFLAMAFLEGQTLKDKIAERPLKLDEALDIAIQTAQGLKAAHQNEVVHRDIKPANLMLTAEGQVKIMDFGLAQLADRSRLTKTTTMLGTPAYMSPEQTRRERTDRRTDIWSLGVVIYEMVTGRLPFEGEREQAVLYAITSEEPEPITALRVGIPMELDRIVSKAMAKESDERYQHSDELFVDLQALRKRLEAKPSGVGAQTASQVVDGSAPSAPRRAWGHPLRQIFPWGLAVVGILLAVWGWSASWLPDRTKIAEPPTRTVITVPADQRLVAGDRSYPLDISPDGRRLVYVAESASRTQLFLREFDQFESQPLPGTEGARYPFFSPDGEWVGFFAEDELQKVSVSGGGPLKICDAPAVNRGATWGPDGTIIFSDARQGLLRVPAGGGEPEALTTIDRDRGELSHVWPKFLPDGRGVLFNIGATEGSITVLSLETGELRHLIGERPLGPAWYLPTGHLVWGEGGGIRAAPFDRSRLELTGPPVLLLHPVYEPPNSGGEFFAVSQTGTLVYVPGGVEHTLVMVDRLGLAKPLTEARRGYRFPRFAPEGRRVAVTVDPSDQEDSDIWVYESERGLGSRVTFEGHDVTSVWSPDSAWVVYSSNYGSSDLELHRRPGDGTGEAERLVIREYIQHPESWSPDGRLLAFTEHHPVNRDDILVLTLLGDRQVLPFLTTPFHERMPRFSPDGRWLAYTSDESGQDEVYVQPYPGPGRKWLLSAGGGREAAWSPDGKELFYRKGDQMMVVGVEIGSTFQADNPRVLFEGRYDATQHGNYDISPDGQHFVMIKRGEPAQFNVVLNWFEELGRRVRAGK